MTELVEANRQFIGSASLIAENFPGAEVVELPGLVAAWCNTEVAFLNAIFLSEPVTDELDLRRRAVSLRKYLATKKKRPLFFACREWIPETLRNVSHVAFGDAGLSASITLTGMAADELPAVQHATSELEWCGATDAETRDQLADINAFAHGISTAAMREALALPEIWTDRFAGYVGRIENQPIATSSVMALNNTLHVMCVATMPAFQRRGHAEEAMRHSLTEMARATGLTRTTLHATDAGKPVYLRMGYHETATFTGYMRPATGG